MYSVNNTLKIIMTVFISLLISTTAIARGRIQSYKNIVYTANPTNPSLQSLDIYTPKTGRNLPVIVFIHGGGWTKGDKKTRSHIPKRDFFVNNNMVFVSINYRMAPQYHFPTYPKDVASAVNFIINNIQKYRGNPNNIFIMGHSAGAHLASLVSTDSSYLNAYRKGLGNIRGTILLDGAGYDIPTTLKGNKKRRRQAMYQQAFSKDERMWKVASPITYVRPKKNIPPFLIFYVASRKQAVIQSSRFSNALKQARVPTHLIPITYSSHRKINASFGQELGLKEQATLSFIQANSVK